MKLFACICNQPQRLPIALAPVRAALIAQPPVSRWGLGYVQGGDVLLVRTPKASAVPVDLAGPLTAEIKTDCVIAQAVRDDATGLGGTDNTPPFRFRRWMYAQTGTPALDEVSPRLLEHVPDYLRRNLKGRTSGELVFHVFLAMLHDEGSVDDPNLAPAATRRALAATVKLVGVELEKAHLAPQTLGCVALSNGRSMVVARFSDQPLRLRRLWVNDDRGEKDPTFRGVLIVTNGDSAVAAKDGFEDVPVGNAVLISRDLQFSLADLNA
jgi:glutamine amidotransferase